VGHRFGIVNSNSRVEFAVSLSRISVDSVWPLYGPVSGGTRVTISGQFLGVSTIAAVHIGNELYPDFDRLSPPLTIVYIFCYKNNVKQ